MQEIQQRIAEARSVHSIDFKDLHLPHTSIGEYLETHAAASPDAVFLIAYDEASNRLEFTYLDFYRRVQAIATYLNDVGVAIGDRIAVLGNNHPDTVLQYFAAWHVGATVVPINMGEDDDRIQYILANSKAVVAFVRDEYVDRMQSCLQSAKDVRAIVVCGAQRDEYNSFDEISLPTVRTDTPSIHGLMASECLIVYTSGTTGHPKGVRLAHGNLLADATGIRDWHGIAHDTRMMCVLPIHHVNGIVVTLISPLVAGASVVLNRKFQTTTFFQRLSAESVGIVSVVPTLLAYLLHADIDTSQFDLTSLRHIICGAGPLTCELADRFEDRYGIPIIHGYGLSETTCYSCFLPIHLSADNRRRWLTQYGFPSIGVPIPQNEMAIHDAMGNEVKAGERGEIVIRGHNVMMEYYGNDQANRDAFTFGWFRSGDEGFSQVDPDSGLTYYFITGRLKELFIRGGVNISPLEIDEVINSHPKVQSGIAVGFENVWYGEEIGALVLPSDSSLTETELLAYCQDHLPYFKSPKVVVFSDTIPVTSTGKYQRTRVRDLFAAYREHQFASKGSA